ncbi:hypothetical protein RCL1_007639 [Eukaryota sp. TZLM3-RCL]
MQPIDQGIVLSFKSHYRKKVVERDFMEKTSMDEIAQVSMVDAIAWMSESWIEVQEKVITNCWKKSGLFIEEISRTGTNNDYQERRHHSDNCFPIVAEDCVFDCITEEEERDLKQEENDYTIERCLDRAFENVVGSSSPYLGTDVSVLTQFQDLETFVFFNLRELMYTDSLLIDVLTRLEGSCNDSDIVLSPFSLSSESALSNAISIKQFLVYRYGFNDAFNLHLSQIRAFLCKDE